MKILYIITDLSTGGGQMMLYQLLSRINRSSFTPVVVSLIDIGTIGDRIQELGIPVYSLGMKQGKPSIAAIRRLIGLVRQIKPDLIQGWMYHANLAAQFASIFCPQKPPVVWDIQGSMYSLKYEKKLTVLVVKLSAYISKFTDNIVYVSYLGQVQHTALGYSSKNSCVIPNGIDTVIFRPTEEHRISVRTELGLLPETILIGLIARFHPQKDHHNFLQAAALLLKSYPNVHFMMAGIDIDDRNPTLSQLIETLGLANNISLLGDRKDMQRLSAAMDIASLSSAYGEASPLVVGEAMSCGVPCVVTDIGDSAWIVGDTGLVVPSRNPEALANGWKKLIDLDNNGRLALGLAARNRIIERFSLDSVVAQYETLYKNVLAQ